MKKVAIKRERVHHDVTVTTKSEEVMIRASPTTFFTGQLGLKKLWLW